MCVYVYQERNIKNAYVQFIILYMNIYIYIYMCVYVYHNSSKCIEYIYSNNNIKSSLLYICTYVPILTLAKPNITILTLFSAM